MLKKPKGPVYIFWALRLFKKNYFLNFFPEIFSFFRKFMNVSKEARFRFFDILQQTGFWKSAKAPLLQF